MFPIRLISVACFQACAPPSLAPRAALSREAKGPALRHTAIPDWLPLAGSRDMFAVVLAPLQPLTLTPLLSQQRHEALARLSDRSCVPHLTGLPPHSHELSARQAHG